MPITFACPSCKTRLTAPDSAAGKNVTCKKCSSSLTVPFLEAEVVEDEPPRRATVARAVPKRPDPREVVDDDFDDEQDDRPIRKKKKSKKSGPPVALIAGIIGGALLLLIGGGVAALMYFGKGPIGGGLAGGVLGTKAPPGFSTVGESACGATVLLPGNIKGQFARTGPGADAPVNPNSYVAGAGSNEMMFVAQRSPGYTPGTSEAELMKIFETMPFVHKPNKHDISGKKSITLGGHPGLQFTLVEKPDLWDDTPQKAEFFEDKNAEETARVARERKHSVYLITTNGEWVYVVSLTKTLADPDPETVKTVAESFKFFEK